MTVDDWGRGVFAEDNVIFYNHFRANFLLVLLLNLDKSQSVYQKYINDKFS